MKIVNNIIIGGAVSLTTMSFAFPYFAAPTVSITGERRIANTVNIKETLIDDSVLIKCVLKDNVKIEMSFIEIEAQLQEMVNAQKKTDNNIQYAEHPFKISEKGKELIKYHESCNLTRYKLKGEKKYTIGWGHQIQPDENIGKTITKSQADKIFDKDCEKFSAYVNILLDEINPNIKVTQGFIDGLGSLIYNCGPTGVKRTRFYSRLSKSRIDKNGYINTDDLQYALAAVKTANITWPGHKPRRQKEYNMMAKK